MKSVVIIAALAVMAGAARAEDQPPVSGYTVTPNSSLSFINPVPSNLVIACGNGQVSISLKTGKVTLTNCPVDKGTQAFWKAVELFAATNCKENQP